MPWNLKSSVKRIGVSDWLAAGTANRAIRPSAAPRGAVRRAICMMTTSRFGCSDRTARRRLGPWLDSDDLALAVRPPGEMPLGKREPHIETDAERREDEQSCEHKRHIESG